MSGDVYSTRGTRFHPKGLQSPLEGQAPHGDTGRIKAPFAVTIYSTSSLKPLLFKHGREAPSIKFVEGEFSEVRIHGVLRRTASPSGSLGTTGLQSLPRTANVGHGQPCELRGGSVG